jgi:RNA polymerase sigma-70 factor, ECF subfamily
MKHHHPPAAAEPVSQSFLTTIADEMLIALIAAHDRGAMGALFVRHKVRVFRFLTRILGDAARAEDLTSEVFIEVWRRAGQFQARSKVSTWILAIAHYKAASALRRKSFDRLDDSAVAAIADPLDDPEAAAQKANCGAILRDCLKQLSPPHREVIDLIYYHEQSITDVARIVGVPENTVKTRAFHARKRIGQMMAARGVEHASL